MPSKFYIIEDAQIREELDPLKSAGHSQPGNLMGFTDGDIPTVQENSARLGPVLAVDAIEQARLTRPVRADDRKKAPPGKTMERSLRAMTPPKERVNPSI